MDLDIADETAGLVLSSDPPISEELVMSPVESKISSNLEPETKFNSRRERD